MYHPYERYATGFGVRLVRGFLLPLLKVLLITFLLYLIIFNMILASFRVESRSMDPTLAVEDRILVSPLIFGAKLPFASLRLPAMKSPERGNLVVVYSPTALVPSVSLAALGSLVKFLTLQRGGIPLEPGGKSNPRYLVKRIVGLPGDTIKMQDYGVSIRPAGSEVFYPEQELIAIPYRINSQSPVPGWREEHPFGGNLSLITLKENEYFVLGDNRPRSSDSRSWGPLPADRLVGKVLLRYWPLKNIVKF